MPTDPKPAFVPAVDTPALNGHKPNDATPYAEPAYVLSPAFAVNETPADAYRSHPEATNGYMLDGYMSNGHSANGHDVNRPLPMPNGSGYEGDYYVPPYGAAPLPIPQWGPAYADTPYPVFPAPFTSPASPMPHADTNGYPVFGPTYGSAPAPYAAPMWSPAEEYAPAPPAYAYDTRYDVSFSPPTYPPGAAWIPEHLTPATPEASFDPVVEYDHTYRTQAFAETPSVASSTDATGKCVGAGGHTASDGDDARSRAG